MFDSLKRLTCVLDVCGILGIFCLLRMMRLMYVGEIPMQVILCLYLVLVEIVIFSLSVILKKLLDALGIESVNVLEKLKQK